MRLRSWVGRRSGIHREHPRGTLSLTLAGGLARTPLEERGHGLLGSRPPRVRSRRLGNEIRACAWCGVSPACRWRCRVPRGYKRVPSGVFAAPVRAHATAWHDNSADNPANPDPTEAVLWVPQTVDEMMLGSIEYYIEGEDPMSPMDLPGLGALRGRAGAVRAASAASAASAPCRSRRPRAKGLALPSRACQHRRRWSRERLLLRSLEQTQRSPRARHGRVVRGPARRRGRSRARRRASRPTPALRHFLRNDAP